MPLFSYSVLHLMLFFLAVISTAQAALYITTPQSHSKCSGGRPCAIEYLDDGETPLLSQIGLCEIGLYTGNQKLVQWIPPQDVSDTLSFTFTPNPKAGPNSSTYYIAFTSVSLKVKNGTTYTGYSPFFSLENMEGSFDKPLPAATSPFPLPSITESATPTSTITVGTLLPTRSTAISRGPSPFTVQSTPHSPSAPPLSSPSPAKPPNNTNSALPQCDTTLFFPLLLLFALM